MQQCCVSKVAADVLVTSANPNLLGNAVPNYWRHTGRTNVDGLLHQLGGHELKKAIGGVANLPLQPGETAVTSSRNKNLDASLIIHCNCPDGMYGDMAHRDTIYTRMARNIFNAAESCRARTLTIPAVGCGVRQWTPAKAAALMLKSISTYQPTHLQTITFALLDARVYRIWNTVAEEMWGAPDSENCAVWKIQVTPDRQST